MLKSLSTSLILRGILALTVGVTALAWPGITVLALVVLFAVYAFMASGLEALRAFSSRTAGPVFGHLLVGLIDLAAGVLAMAWPGPTALVLVLIVASWAVIAGVTEVAAAFRGRESAGTRALFTLGGLISVAFGAVLFAHPAVGAITVALLFGLFNLVYGARTLVQGIELRRTRNALHSAVPERIQNPATSGNQHNAAA
ncbi:MAG: HdeD family acid-resistance protein [Streptosporangiaceae bacterium]